MLPRAPLTCILLEYANGAYAPWYIRILVHARSPYFVSLHYSFMTLRDDVVFVIFLVQWWKYPVDQTRPDEFGFTYLSEEAKEQETRRLADQAGQADQDDQAEQNKEPDPKITESVAK